MSGSAGKLLRKKRWRSRRLLTGNPVGSYQRYMSCGRKIRYISVETALAMPDTTEAIRVYHCPLCGAYHRTHRESLA
jgi:hypothetical protein